MSDKSLTSSTFVFISIPVLLFLIVGILLAVIAPGVINPDPEKWPDALNARLSMMFVVAVFIERAVEVYLNASGRNGPDRFRLDKSLIVAHNESTAIVAGTFSISLGLIAAFAGVRILDVFGAPVIAKDADFGNLITYSWYGIDVFISGGLLGGGATIFHEIAETLRGGIIRVGDVVKPQSGHEIVDDPWNDSNYMTPDTVFEIKVIRKTEDTGVLLFSHGAVSVNTTCWWDPEEKINAGVYENCSKTIMATKRYPAIFIQGARSSSSQIDDIFIHKGTNPDHSDGCIVIHNGELMKLYNAISPMNGANVIVTVEDLHSNKLDATKA